MSFSRGVKTRDGDRNYSAHSRIPRVVGRKGTEGFQTIETRGSRLQNDKVWVHNAFVQHPMEHHHVWAKGSSSDFGSNMAPEGDLMQVRHKLRDVAQTAPGDS